MLQGIVWTKANIYIPKAQILSEQRYRPDIGINPYPLNFVPNNVFLNINPYEMINIYCKDNYRWLVGCIEDLRPFSNISAILQLGSRRPPVPKIVVSRLGIKPRA